MTRVVRVYPGCYLDIDNLDYWIKIKIDNDAATELWIDISHIRSIDFSNPCFNNINQVYFYDFFHAVPETSDQMLSIVKQTAERYSTTWYTCNVKQIPGINCIKFDYLWNRSKRAILEGIPGWKNVGNGLAYERSPMNWNKRNKKYLSLNRIKNSFRTQLINCLENYDGYLSDCNKNQILGNEYTTDLDIYRGLTVPPSKKFFDDSYISCQVESQYKGLNSIIFTEKTYDHLVRGRIVLNFGPRGFHQALEFDGWKLPKDIDLSWDLEPNTNLRFKGYINMLHNILNKSTERLHKWFIINQDVIEHNYNMLKNKPYDYI